MNTAQEVPSDLDNAAASVKALCGHEAPSGAPHSGSAANSASAESDDLVRLQQFLDKHAPEDCAPEPPRPSRARRRNRRASRQKLALPAAPAGSDINLAAHEARCSICCDPEREAIEEEFVHWHNTRHIAREYDLDRRAIYRHAHALKLFAVRDRNLRYALGHIIEQAGRVDCKAESIICAVRAFTRVNDAGRWIEPPSQVIVSSGSRPAVRPVLHSPPQAAFEVIDQPVLAAAPGRKPAKKRRRSPDNRSRSKRAAKH